MRRISAAALVFFPALLTAQNTRQPSAAEQALIESNASVSRALATGDTTALASLLAGDLVYTNPSTGAAQSRAQLLAAVASGYRLQTGTPAITRAHIDGNLGLLEFDWKIASAARDSVTVHSSAVYVLRASRWQLTSMNSTGAPIADRPPATPTVTQPITPTPSPMVTATRMKARAAGSFEVATQPLSPYNTAPGAGVGRLSIDKQYHGDLEGTGKGEMLSAGNPGSGSAGYVAVEVVTGAVGGRRGSFALQHFGTMDGGALSLTIAIVPGSGTGELSGIAGTMNIIVENGKHSYVLDYSLPGGR